MPPSLGMKNSHAGPLAETPTDRGTQARLPRNHSARSVSPPRADNDSGGVVVELEQAQQQHRRRRRVPRRWQSRCVANRGADLPFASSEASRACGPSVAATAEAKSPGFVHARERSRGRHRRASRTCIQRYGSSISVQQTAPQASYSLAHGWRFPPALIGPPDVSQSPGRDLVEGEGRGGQRWPAALRWRTLFRDCGSLGRNRKRHACRQKQEPRRQPCS
jgi:hypothetical protein